MSDGPHRSLPMRPGWKKVAKYADSQVHETEEVCNALVVALEKDCRKDIPPKLIDLIRRACDPPLLPDHTILSLEGLHSVTLGSAMGDALLDNVRRFIIGGKFGEAALEKAMLNTLLDHSARCKRQIGEHYLRESSVGRTQNVEQRVEEAIQVGALKSLASQLLSSRRPKSIHRIKKHDGVEDGVRLL